MPSKGISNGKFGGVAAMTQWVSPGMSHIQRSVLGEATFILTYSSKRALEEL